MQDVQMTQRPLLESTETKMNFEKSVYYIVNNVQLARSGSPSLDFRRVKRNTSRSSPPALVQARPTRSDPPGLAPARPNSHWG